MDKINDGFRKLNYEYINFEIKYYMQFLKSKLRIGYLYIYICTFWWFPSKL